LVRGLDGPVLKNVNKIQAKMTFKKLKNNKAQTMRIKWMSILIKMSQKVSSNNTRMK
jgi:hypothetical protein